MSFTTNSSNLSGKSTTNAFDVIANSLTVNQDALVKGDLTVLGNTNIGSVTLENANVDFLTVNHLTATNPIPITSGGTGLATIGSPNQVLTVNPAGTGLYYTSGLVNPVTILGTGFTGTPTFNFGIEADTGSLGRGFIRTGPTATSGLVLGTTSATVLRLWSNFSTDSNAEITNTNANFTYNSTGSSGVFQVLNNGGGISFTNSGVGTISMATAGGTITLADPLSLSGAVNINTAGGIFNLSTGAGATNITTVAGNMNFTTGAGAISLTTGLGNINLTTVGAGMISLTTETAGAINIGATVGVVNLYGSAVTLGSPVIYIGTGSAVPIPSVVTFACGAVTGITGAWTITTLGFQLNALSISLNSTSTIALNNNTTVAGSLRASGNVDPFSAGDGVCMGLQNDGYATINLNGTQGKGGYIDFSTNGVDFYGRIVGNPSPNRLEYSASQHIFTNETGGLGSVSIIGNTSMTGTLQVNNQTTISASFSTYADAPLKVINTNANPIFTSSFLAPNIAFDNFVFMGFGKSLTPSNAGIFNFRAAATPTTAWTMYGSSSMITQEHNGRVLITATSTNITGPLQVTNGNIFTTQNIIEGITTLNNGDLALTAASPGTILIRGGTGSIITLPDATTLIEGYSYTINNNSNHTATINQFTSGSAGIVAPNNMATVTCISTSSPNGQWDLHVSGLNPNTDWANPGAIGSITPNTGQFTTLGAISTIKANSTNLVNTSTLNPAITVLSGVGYEYGMDYGFNPSTSRFRTRIFSTADFSNPGDVALSIRPPNASTQAQFIDYLIVNGSTGKVLINATSTDITGPLQITSSNSSFTSSLFTATNNTITSGITGAFLAPNLNLDQSTGIGIGKSLSNNNFTFLLFGNNTVPTAVWSIYNSSSFISQQLNGTIDMSGSKITLQTHGGAEAKIVLENNNTVNVSGTTTITSSLSSYTNSSFKVINTNTEPLFTASVLAPNMVLDTPIFLAIGKSLSGSNAAIFGFGNNATPSTLWSMYNSTTQITQEFNGQITLTAPRTQINGNTLITTSFSLPDDAMFKVVNTNPAPIFSSAVLAPNVEIGNIVGFAVGKSLSTSNASLFVHKNNGILPASSWGMYNSTTEIEQKFNGEITLKAPTTVATGSLQVSGNVRVSGNVSTISAGDGVCMGLQTDGYASITLNGTQGNSGYIDFATNGVDFYTRIMGKPSLDMDYYANAHNFKTQDGGNNVALLPNFLAPGQTLILDTNRQIRSRIGGSNTVYNAAANTSVGNNGWTSINNLLNVRTKGFGRLIWVNQSIGFRNETGQAVLVSVTFSCQRVSNGFGVTALRIVAAGFVLGVQDVAALDAVSISGQAYLENNETIDCQIYQNSGVTVEYHNVYVNLNTFPLP